MKVMVWSVVDSRWLFDGLLKEVLLCVREEEWVALVCSPGCTLNCWHTMEEEDELLVLFNLEHSIATVGGMGSGLANGRDC